jgi:hypothetical protein
MRANPAVSPAPGIARSVALSADAEEALLIEIDDALNTTRVRELRAIDALTPGVRAMAVNLR